MVEAPEGALGGSWLKSFAWESGENVQAYVSRMRRSSSWGGTRACPDVCPETCYNKTHQHLEHLVVSVSCQHTLRWAHPKVRAFTCIACIASWLDEREAVHPEEVCSDV
eukprot:5811018-Amphidinium_carterae.1